MATKEKNLILIGGSAGSGKSTVTSLLVQRLGAVPVRFHESFNRVASALNIVREKAFTSKLVTEQRVWADYQSRVILNELTVSDIHYAIQPKNDSALALGYRLSTQLDCEEPFQRSFNSGLLDLLVASGIKLTLILLIATPSEAFKRVRIRDGNNSRFKALGSIASQCEAEYQVFLEHADRKDAQSMRIDSNSTSPCECVELIRGLIEL